MKKMFCVSGELLFMQVLADKECVDEKTLIEYGNTQETRLQQAMLSGGDGSTRNSAMRGLSCWLVQCLLQTGLFQEAFHHAGRRKPGIPGN